MLALAWCGEGVGRHGELDSPAAERPSPGGEIAAATISPLSLCRAPTIASAAPTTPTTAVLSANAPGAGGPFASYTFTAAPSGGSGSAVTATCPSPSDCAMSGLKSGVSYDVTVVAGTGAGATPPSAPAPMTMPPPASPTLTSADATGPTQGSAAATAPSSGGPWDTYTFTATPLGGGSAVVVDSATPAASLNGLQPGTQYSVGVVAKGAGGPSPASNKLTLATPSLKWVAGAGRGDGAARWVGVFWGCV